MTKRVVQEDAGRCLVIDASNVSAGGAKTYLREILSRADMAPFERIIVFGGKGLGAIFPVDGPKIVLVEDPDLPPVQWRHSGLRNLPAYIRQTLKVLRWRERTLPKRLLSYQRCVLFGANGILPRHTPSGVRRAVVSRNMLPFDDGEARRFGWGIQRLRLTQLRRQQAGSFRTADAVIFLSQYARGAIGSVAKLDPSRTASAVIYNGVDSSLYRPAPDLAERLKRKPQDILYVSSLDRYKHHVEVVQAFARLRERTRANMRLHFAGWEHPRSRASVQRTISEFGLTGTVILHGVLQPKKLAELYQNCDLFVFASTCENCPTIMIEAMACGLPMACTNKSPMTEIAANAALTFDAEDPEDIAHALSELTSNRDLRANLSGRSLARAKDFSWNKTAHQTYGMLFRINST